MIPIYLISGDRPFRLDLLVIGGGGGGGQGAGGGGGGGGYLCTVLGENSGGPSTALDAIVFTGGQTITVTVGAGGSVNSNGNKSVFGPLNAVAGGRGGYSSVAAGSGGSGGGAANVLPDGGAGTFNQGNDGSDFVDPGVNFPVTYQSGAGGGASTAAVASKDAGFGISSSITGSSVARAGGGGGSAGTGIGRGGFGRDGGGDGSRNDAQGGASSQATAGQTNTGGGGGGGYDSSFPGKAGGSGFIVVRYPSLARIIHTIDPGLTYTFSDDGTFKRYVFTAGSGNITF